MKTTLEYLDTAKKALGIESDYGIAQYLNVTRQAINNWRKNRQVMDDYAAAKIAEALGLNPMEVIAAANLEREKGEERKSYWRKVFEACAAACLLLSAGAFEIKDLQAAEVDETRIMRNF